MNEELNKVLKELRENRHQLLTMQAQEHSLFDRLLRVLENGAREEVGISLKIEETWKP